MHVCCANPKNQKNHPLKNDDLQQHIWMETWLIYNDMTTIYMTYMIHQFAYAMAPSPLIILKTLTLMA